MWCDRKHIVIARKWQPIDIVVVRIFVTRSQTEVIVLRKPLLCPESYSCVFDVEVRSSRRTFHPARRFKRQQRLVVRQIRPADAKYRRDAIITVSLTKLCAAMCFQLGSFT